MPRPLLPDTAPSNTAQQSGMSGRRTSTESTLPGLCRNGAVGSSGLRGCRVGLTS